MVGNLMKVFVISLQESTERRERIEKLLSAQKVSFSFFNAVNVKKVNLEQYPYYNRAKTVEKKGYQLTNAEIGCYLSHYEMWQQCIELKEPILVLEDNVEICTDLADFLEFAKNNIDTLGIIKFGSYFTKNSTKVCEVNSTVNLVKYNKGAGGTSCYMITPSVSQRYVSLSNEFYSAVDDFMDMEYRTQIPLFTFSPDVIGRSEIQSTIGARKNKDNLMALNKVYIELNRVLHQIKRFIFNLKFNNKIQEIQKKIRT